MNQVKTALVFTGYNLLNSSYSPTTELHLLPLKTGKRGGTGAKIHSQLQELMGTNGNPGRKVFVFKPACINWNEYYGRIEAYIRTGFRYARAMKKVLQNISQLLMQKCNISVTHPFCKVPLPTQFWTGTVPNARC